MDVTEEGMAMAVRPVQLKKGQLPVDVTEEGMVTATDP